MSILKELKGKKINSVEFILSSTNEINNKENTSLEVHLLLFFNDYYLSIFNNFSLLVNNKNVNKLVGDTLIEIKEDEDTIDFIFLSGERLQVNMKEDGYSGPEAMHLAGPNSLNVVWN